MAQSLHLHEATHQIDHGVQSTITLQTVQDRSLQSLHLHAHPPDHSMALKSLASDAGCIEGNCTNGCSLVH